MTRNTGIPHVESTSPAVTAHAVIDRVPHVLHHDVPAGVQRQPHPVQVAGLMAQRGGHVADKGLRCAGAGMGFEARAHPVQKHVHRHPEDVVGVHHALGHPRGARGEHHLAHVVRPRPQQITLCVDLREKISLNSVM